MDPLGKGQCHGGYRYRHGGFTTVSVQTTSRALWPVAEDKDAEEPETDKETKHLLGERPAMRLHREQPELWTCVGRPRAKKQRHTSLRMIRHRPYASTDILLRSTAQIHRVAKVQITLPMSSPK